MTDYRLLAVRLAEGAANAAAGLRRIVDVLASGTAVGALLGGAGVHLLGAHPIAALATATVLAAPIIALWRLRTGLQAIAELPGQFRTLPAKLDPGPAGLADLRGDLDSLALRPRTPRALLRSLQQTRKIYLRLEALIPSDLVTAGLTLTPGAFFAGALSALWGAAAFVLGLCLMLTALTLS